MLRRGRCFAWFSGSWSDLCYEHFSNCPTLLFLYKLTVGRVKLKLLKMKKVMFTAFAVGLSLTASVVAQVPSYVPTNGLVGYWPFNGNANDESGNGNNGTVNGPTLTTDRFGNPNVSYYFNNTGSITIPTIQFQNYLNSGFSISYWFTMQDSTSTNGDRNMIITNYDGVNGLQIEYNPSNNLTLRHSLRTANASPPEINYSQPLSVFNTWKNGVFVWSPPYMRTYINGILTNETLGTQITNLSVCCGVQTKFGSAWNGTGNHYGKLDDIGVWNRALTNQEVLDLYNSINCSNNTSITPQTNSISTGGNVTFTANTSDANASFSWQSDLGQGFQTLNNYGNYSGVNTNTLTVSNVQLSEHNQQIRAISTSGNCIDTSNVATIQIADTCITNVSVFDTTFVTVFDTTYVTIYDTLLTTVTDTLIINTTLGLPAPNNENTILIYPNPASDHITIDNGNYTAMAGYTIKIENNAGQQVFQSLINQAQFYVDLSTWSGNGLYFVHLIDAQGNTVTVRKIVLQ